MGAHAGPSGNLPEPNRWGLDGILAGIWLVPTRMVLVTFGSNFGEAILRDEHVAFSVIFACEETLEYCMHVCPAGSGKIKSLQ